MTPGTPVNFRPLWGLLAVLAGLCAGLFFACPLAAKHQTSREIRIQHFARLEQPPMLPVALQRPQAPPKPMPAVAKAPIASIPQACTVCAEPAQRYIHALQSPFPENRPIYEMPKVVNHPSTALAYSAARPAPYAAVDGNVHP